MRMENIQPKIIITNINREEVAPDDEISQQNI